MHGRGTGQPLLALFSTSMVSAGPGTPNGNKSAYQGNVFTYLLLADQSLPHHWMLCKFHQHSGSDVITERWMQVDIRNW